MIHSLMQCDRLIDGNNSNLIHLSLLSAYFFLARQPTPPPPPRRFTSDILHISSIAVCSTERACTTYACGNVSAGRLYLCLSDTYKHDDVLLRTYARFAFSRNIRIRPNCKLHSFSSCSAAQFIATTRAR